MGSQRQRRHARQTRPTDCCSAHVVPCAAGPRVTSRVILSHANYAIRDGFGGQIALISRPASATIFPLLSALPWAATGSEMERGWLAVLVVMLAGAVCGGEATEAPPPQHGEESHRVVEAIARLKLPDRRDRLQALDTIKRFPDKAVPWLIKAARNDDSVFRARVANALGLVGKGDRDAVWALGVLLRDPDTFVRREAIAALGQAADAAVVPQLEPLLEDASEAVRADAALAIAELQPERAAERLKAWLAHPHARVRRTALAELLRRKDPALAAALPALLKDKDPGVRGAAAAALPQVAGKEAVPALVELLGDADPYVRATAVVALKDLRAAATIPRLIEMLADKAEDVQAEAVSALGALQARNAIPALIGQLTAPSRQLRERAAVALGLFREQARAAVPGLILLLGDADEGVRQKADLALRLILRANVGFQAAGSTDHRREATLKWHDVWRKAQPSPKGK
ncbi:MAG: HEAT repeat domain-containing protein [Planctomycetes bacterium]|nr:HEAT repeat domain-containing protein [Planctomycetota bacterium]